MSRYIDKEVVRRAIQEYCYSPKEITPGGIAKVVMSVPTVDAVEVVRCKDCKYWDTRDSKGIQGICLCGEKDFYYGSEFYPFAEDYCSYGERREG